MDDTTNQVNEEINESEEATASEEAIVSEESDESEETSGSDEADEADEPTESDTNEEADESAESDTTDEADEPAESSTTDEADEQEEAVETNASEEATESEEAIVSDESDEPEEPAEIDETAEADEPEEAVEANASEEATESDEASVSEEIDEPEESAESDKPAEAVETNASEKHSNNEIKRPKKKKWWIGVVVTAAVIVIVIFLLLQFGKVSVGGMSVSRNAEELTLTSGEFDPGKLATALPKLSKLKKISFPDMEMSAEELDAIRKAAEGVEVDFTVDINGQSCDPATKAVDLSGIKAEQLPELAEKLRLLPNLSEVELMATDGSSALSISDVKQLTAAVPNAGFHYEFDLFGKHISTTDERVEFENVPIGNEGADEIREALSIMSGCKYLLLDTCGIDNEVMAKIRDEFPDKKIVWRIYLDTGYPFDFLTDEQILRLTYGLNDENSKVLQYCTDVVYLDIGHNEALTDFSFLSNMTELECLIASLASVTDLSPLVSCQKLIWVELIDCYYLTDITPLKDIPSIRYLSISETEVSDISATDTLPNLERFGAVKRNIAPEAQERFRALHPDCIAIFDWDENPYGYGWRYNHGTTFEYYAHMREAFRYDDGGFFGNQKEAVYCPMYMKDVPGYPWYDWQS